MDMVELAARLRRLNPKVAAATERLARRVPALRSRLEREYDRMLAGMEAEVKTYRERAVAERRTRRPAIVAPTSAHVAFDKAARYFGMRMVRVPVGRDFRADVAAMRSAITRDTVVVVGSAPGFPHGVIDPI